MGGEDDRQTKAEMLRATKSSHMKPGSSLESRGGCELGSNCITESHPCNLKYFMDPEVHHVEQLPLLRWGQDCGRDVNACTHTSTPCTDTCKPGKGWDGAGSPLTHSRKGSKSRHCNSQPHVQATHVSFHPQAQQTPQSPTQLRA